MKNNSLFENGCFLALLAGSMFSILVLCGLYAYAGTLLPVIGESNRAEAMQIWLMWAVIVCMPTVTFLWWLAARIKRRKG